MMCDWGHWQGLDELQLDGILSRQETCIKCLLCSTATSGTGAGKINPSRSPAGLREQGPRSKQSHSPTLGCLRAPGSPEDSACGDEGPFP